MLNTFKWLARTTRIGQEIIVGENIKHSFLKESTEELRAGRESPPPSVR
jgi:hypothetical protein